ncbi:MAG: phosphodiester glycosidase family protein [Clostridium sp.]|nr:phosphodiester glycosidase family protein [Bacteroides sp.]MCM1197355.1 phosphodiester glycosidase family protein [Clostridium sp.]
MKTQFSLWGRWLSAAVLILPVLFSCEKDPQQSGGKQENSNVPFSSISVTADGETAEGQADHDALSIVFAFSTAEDFSNASLDAVLNSGYTLTYPDNPALYGSYEDKTIYFKTPENKTVKYSVSMTSKALPVIDASKVTVEGTEISFNLGTKEFVITYAEGMDRSNVHIVFGEGSLAEGAVVEQTSWDLSEGPSTVVVKMNGMEVAYIVRIDYSAVMTSPSSWGFADVTSSAYEKKYPSLKVYRADALTRQVPARNSGEESHVWWNCSSYEDQIAKCGFLGDYTDSREKVNADFADGSEFVIVTFDAAAFGGNLVPGTSPDAVNASVVMTGAPAAASHMLKVDGNMLVSSVDSWWVGPFGTFVGFSSEGKMDISQAAVESGVLKVLPYFSYSDFGNYGERVTDDTYKPRTAYVDYIGEEWNINSAIYINPMLVRNGKALAMADLLINDGDSEVFGEGYNGSRSRSFIGKTLDNKIGLAVVTKGNFSMQQAAYVLYDLGWTDICYAGGSYWKSDSFVPSIFIDGALVAGIEGSEAECVYAFNAR